MRVELPKKKIPVFISLNNIDYIYRDTSEEDTGGMIMSSGKEIKIVSGMGELLKRIKEHPYTPNIL